MQTRNLDRIRFVTRYFNDLQGLRYWVPLGMITLSAGGTTYFDNRPFVLLRAALFVGAFLLMLIARRYYRNTFGEVERQPVLPAAEPATLSIYSPAGPTLPIAGPRGISPVVQRFLRTMGLAFVLLQTVQALSPTGGIGIVVDESLVQPPWLTSGNVIFVPEYPFPVSSSPVFIPISSPSPSVFGAQVLYALYGSFFLGVWLWRERRLSQSYYLALGALLLGLSAAGVSMGFFILQDGPAALFVGSLRPLAIHLWVALLLCGSSMVLVGLLDHLQLVRALRRPAVSKEDER
jgi:hypothetical protein